MLIIKSGGIEKIREYIGEELFERQLALRYFCLPCREAKAYYISFCYLDIREPRKKEERLCIYCGESELVLAADSVHAADDIKAMPADATPFELLAEYLSSLTSEDVYILEKLENDINELELGILKTEKPVKGVISRIIEFRHTLLRMKHYYEQMDSVIDRLAENELSLIPPDIQPRFVSLGRRIHNLLSSVAELREYVTQAREAYQAKIDIEQNEIMKVFTVITAIFLPLTLIVGWYGMNFSMPELRWEGGYPYVILLSLGVCAFCFYLFKKKKWF